MTGCRYRSDVGYEGQCDECREWWPLEADHWYPRHGMRRCKACINGHKQEYLRQRRADPALRAEEVANLRIKRHANREATLEYRRAYYAKNRERICAQRRAAWAAAPHRKIEARRRYKRDWMRRHREELRRRFLPMEQAA